MRIVHAVFLLAVLLLALQAEQLAGTGTGYSTTFLGALVFVAGFDGLLAFYFRRKRLFPSLEKMRRDSIDAGALKEWRTTTLLSLCLTFSIALYGLVLRIHGASRRASWPIFLLAMILMLVWRPKLDADAGVHGTQANQ